MDAALLRDRIERYLYIMRAVAPKEVRLRENPMQTSQDEAAIQRLLVTYVETWKRNDMRAWGELFTPDADFVTHTGLWWRSRAENVAGHEAVPASLIAQKAGYELRVMKTELLTSGIALIHATWRWPDLLLPGSARPTDAEGIITMVLVRSADGRWSIRASQNTKALRLDAS